MIFLIKKVNLYKHKYKYVYLYKFVFICLKIIRKGHNVRNHVVPFIKPWKVLPIVIKFVLNAGVVG